MALLCAAVYGVWVAFLPPPASTDLPLFTADPSAYKLVPDDPGGESIPNTGVIVLEDTISGESSTGFEQLMPEPEEPLALDPEADTAPAEVVVDVEASDVAEVVVDVDSDPIFSAEEVSAYMDEMMSEAVDGAPSGTPLPTAKPDPPPAPAEMAGRVAAGAGAAPEPADGGAGLSFDDVAAAISDGSSGAGDGPPDADGEPSVEVAPSGDGVVRVQIAAYSTRGAATAAWERLHVNHNDLLGNVDAPLILETILGEATFYRLQVGAYRNRADAEALCSGLKRKGVDCLVIGP